MRTAAIGPITDIDERPLTTQSGRSEKSIYGILHPDLVGHFVVPFILHFLSSLYGFLPGELEKH